MRVRRSQLLPILAACLAVLMLTNFVRVPAAADEGDEGGTLIPADWIELTTDFGSDPLEVGFTAAGDAVSIVGGSIDYNASTILNDCYPVGEQSICMGTDVGRLNIAGGAPVEIQGGFLERQALEWMIPEASAFLQGSYDLPADDRIETYAAAEIRAYMVNRILDIIDRAAYGVPLTADEARTLDVVANEMLRADRRVAELAHHEYLTFRADPCAYSAPPAPVFVEDPLALPADVTAFCSRVNHPSWAAFEITTPQPSVEHFKTWAAYRYFQDEVAVSDLTSVGVQQNLTGTMTAIALGVGIPTVAAAGGLISLAVAGASTGTAKAIIGAVSSIGLAALKHWGVAPAVYGSLAGGLAAGTVSILLVAVLIAAIAIWQLAEYEAVGTNLSQGLDAARAAADPWGLAELRVQNAGKELREGMTEDNLPSYRTEGVAGLSEIVTRWMTIGSGGVAVPDATGVWQPTTAGAWQPTTTSLEDDWTWAVTDSEGNEQQLAELVFPLANGELGTVRFDRGWMVVTVPDGPDGPQAALQFSYLLPDGETVQVVSRQADGTLLVTDLRPDGTEFGEPALVDSIQFLHPETGELMTARLVDPNPAPEPDPEPVPDPELLGPRPTVAGRLAPGWTHNLRPNPIDEFGNFDLTRFQADYSYAWELERHDDDAGWVGEPVEDATSYGARFTPTVTGEYRARVTMTSLADSSVVKTGAVDFTVGPPTITLDEGTLADDGFDELRVDLAMSQDIGSGNLAVEVQWPGELGSDEPGPVATVDVACLPDTATSCTTPATGAVPVLRDALTFQVGPLTDLTQPVEVTVTNDHGGAAALTLPIDHPDRPQFADPGPADPGQDGSVAFGSYVTDLQVPAATTGGANYVVAGIDPGEGPAGFSVVDPATGNVATGFEVVPGNPRMTVAVYEDDAGQWVVGLHAVPTWEDVGAYVVPISLVQANGRQATMVLHLDVTPAPGDRYRAVLGTDVDPLDFAVDALPALDPLVVGGKTDWDAYDGELCMSLLNTNAGPPARETCGPVDQFTGPDGELVFPWTELAPRGIEFGIHRAHTWLADTEQSYPEPYRVSFFMRSAPPVIDGVDWDGELLTLTASPGDADLASVTCELDGQAVAACFDPAGGSWDPGDLTEGPHELLVHLTDAVGNYATATTEFTVAPQVVAEPTTTTLTVDGEPTSGTELTLGAAVAPAEASGTVTFRDGDADLATVTVVDGQASAAVVLGAGSHSLTAAFAPDTEAWEASESEAVVVEIARSASTTALELSRGYGTYGTTTTATVSVTGESAPPSGTVEIRAGDEVLASGELTVEGPGGTAVVELPSDLPYGLYDLTAVFAGNDDVAGSTSEAAAYLVLPALPRVAIDAPSSVPRGDAPQITVEVESRDGGPVPTGTVTVMAGLQVVDEVTVGEDGTASVQLPAVTRFTLVTAIYSGDHGYLPGLAITTIRPQ